VWSIRRYAGPAARSTAAAFASADYSVPTTWPQVQGVVNNVFNSMQSAGFSNYSLMAWFSDKSGNFYGVKDCRTSCVSTSRELCAVLSVLSFTECVSCVSFFPCALAAAAG